MISNQLLVEQWEWTAAIKYFQYHPSSNKLSRHHGLNHSFIKIGGVVYAMAEKGNLLGKGGFGKVKVVQDVNGYNYALKIITKDDPELETIILGSQGMFSGRTERKGSENKTTLKKYILQPLIQGKNLFDLIEAGLPELSIRYQIALNIALAIKALQLKRIVHADLSPKNIMVDLNNENAVNLIDFGSALIFEDNQESLFHAIITSGFSDPSVKNEYKLYLNSDVYSLGKIFSYLELTDHFIQQMCLPSATRLNIDEVIIALYEKMHAKNWLATKTVLPQPIQTEFMEIQDALRQEILQLQHEKSLLKERAEKQDRRLNENFLVAIYKLSEQLSHLRAVQDKKVDLAEMISNISHAHQTLNAVRNDIAQSKDQTLLTEEESSKKAHLKTVKERQTGFLKTFINTIHTAYQEEKTEPELLDIIQSLCGQEKHQISMQDQRHHEANGEVFATGQKSDTPLQKELTLGINASRVALLNALNYNQLLKKICRTEKEWKLVIKDVQFIECINDWLNYEVINAEESFNQCCENFDTLTKADQEVIAQRERAALLAVALETERHKIDTTVAILPTPLENKDDTPEIGAIIQKHTDAQIKYSKLMAFKAHLNLITQPMEEKNESPSQLLITEAQTSLDKEIACCKETLHQLELQYQNPKKDLSESPVTFFAKKADVQPASEQPIYKKHLSTARQHQRKCTRQPFQLPEHKRPK